MTADHPSAKREYLAVLGLLAAGGGLGLVARAQSWGTAEVASSFTATSTTVSGADLAPLVSATPLVALAAVVLIPAVRRLGRRIAGGALALLGAATLVSVVVVGSDLEERTRRWITSVPDQSDSVQDLSTSPIWVVAAGVGAVLVLAVGVVVAFRGPRWPSMGVRYERPGGRRRGSAGTAPGGNDGRVGSSAQAWDALDRGDDPTT